MGHRTLIVINNDCLHNIEKDSNFGQKVSYAISSYYSDKKSTRIDNGAAIVYGLFHYQDSAGFLFGGPFNGNYLNLHNMNLPYLEKDIDIGLEVLKYLANKYGFDLKEKQNEKD